MLAMAHLLATKAVGVTEAQAVGEGDPVQHLEAGIPINRIENPSSRFQSCRLHPGWLPVMAGLPKVIGHLHPEPDIGRWVDKPLFKTQGQVGGNGYLTIQNAGETAPGYTQLSGRGSDRQTQLGQNIFT